MTAIHAPQIFINNYLQEKIGLYLDLSMPFIPTSPTNIDDLTEQFPEGAFAVYDRMFKMRRKPFPHIKCEQIMYYFYKTSDDIEKLYRSQQLVQDLLDRGDESAQDINAWIYDKWVAGGKLQEQVPNVTTGVEDTKDVIKFSGDSFLLPYFHEIKIFQLEETRDIIDFGTARTWAGNKIIIDYDWHSS